MTINHLKRPKSYKHRYTTPKTITIIYRSFTKKIPKNMEYSSMRECDTTFKPTQISPQNPHHQLPKVHKKKIHQNNFQTLTQ